MALRNDIQRKSSNIEGNPLGLVEIGGRHSPFKAQHRESHKQPLTDGRKIFSLLAPVGWWVSFLKELQGGESEED